MATPRLTVGWLSLSAATVVAILLHCPVAASVLGASAAAIAIALTYIIARQQGVEATLLSKAVGRVEHLLLELREKDSVDDYEAPLASLEQEELPLERPGQDAAPGYEPEAIAVLQMRNVRLDFDNLKWRKKEPLPGLPGNHGWFVETRDDPQSERWFVRKGNGMTARKAMPRDLLDALERGVPVDPRAIRLDFQEKNHGNASW